MYTYHNFQITWKLLVKRQIERLLVQVLEGEISSPELTPCAVPTLIRCLFHPMLQHVKDSGHCAKSAGGRLHLNTHTPMTQQSQSGLSMLSRYTEETFQGNEHTCNLSGNTRPQSSQLDEPLWTDPGLQSGIGVRVLISTSKKKKKKRAGGESIEPSQKVLTSEEKASTKKPLPRL